MLVIIRHKADDAVFKKVGEDFDGYTKVVVDLKRKILAAGGKLHADGEDLLLKDGSRQLDLWGGGIDLETGSVDFDSMINLRPQENNASREVLNQEIRREMTDIIHGLLR